MVAVHVVEGFGSFESGSCVCTLANEEDWPHVKIKGKTNLIGHPP